MDLKYAIVRTPGRSIIDGITSVDLGKPDYQKALLQHQAYIKALECCGLEVEVLDALEEHPDSCFVEDVALLTPGLAIVTNPGAISRKRETEYIKGVLACTHNRIEKIFPPGTLEGGDIMRVDDTYYIGISERTNLEGYTQASTILKDRGFNSIPVQLNEMLHLKTGLSYLNNNNLLITGEFLKNPIFDQFNKIVVEDDESYAANAILVNDCVIMPEGFPKTTKIVENTGYKVVTLDVSEFQKIDGGLSCLSLRF